MKIGMYSLVDKNAEIGKNVKIGNYTQISGNVVIEDDVIIGDGCKIGFCDSVNERIRVSQNKYFKKFLVAEKKCTIKKGSIIYDGSTIFNKVIVGEGSNIGNLAFIRSNCRLERGVTIGFSVSISPFVEIGEGSIILNYSAIGSSTKIGKRVFISPGVMLAENKHMLANDYRNRKGPTIEDYVRIGALCTVISCKIGKFSVIGANSVVTKDVPQGVLFINAKQRKLSLRKKNEYKNSFKS